MSTKLVDKFKNKWGFDFGHKTDEKFFQYLKKQGLSSLAKLLKRFK